MGMVRNNKRHARSGSFRFRNAHRFAAWTSVVLLGTPSALAQGLRFGNHRELAVPDYAAVRIGPFYSTMALSASAGYRWTRSSGAATDLLRQTGRGRIREDGSEFPIVSVLDFRNYLILSRDADLDMSVRVGYEYYPMNTQEDQFFVSLAEEGIAGNFSTEVIFSPRLKGTLFDNFLYRTDYVDTRGILDETGGQRFEFIDNQVGLNMDWLLAEDKNIAGTLSRTDVIPRSDGFDHLARTTYGESLAFEQRIVPGIVGGAMASFAQTEYTATNRPNAATQNYALFGRFGLRAQKGEGLAVTPATTVRAQLGMGTGYTYARSGQSLSAMQDEKGDATSMTGLLALETQLRRDTKHALSYTRGIRTGFDSDFETFDQYGYDLNWQGDLSSASVYSRYTPVQTSRRSVGEYTDWVSGAHASIPLTRIIKLMLATEYSVRDNRDATLPLRTPEEVAADAARGRESAQILRDAERGEDYRTWMGQVGTSFEVTRSVSFATYVQRFERMSDSDVLTYSRDIFSAMFTYFHQF